MGQAKLRGSLDDRIAQAQADARAAERMAACNRRMAERIERERVMARKHEQSPPAVVSRSRLPHVATSRASLAAVLACAVLAGVGPRIRR
jgi:E3 ubiquitin-protein ligase DOA10